MTGDMARLAGILGRLGSDFAGERDAAALMAARWIRSRNLCWADVLVPALPGPAPRHDSPARQPPPPPTDGPTTDWRAMLTACLQNPERLTPWERDFCAGLGRCRRLTPKQRAVLERMAAKVRA